MNQRTLLDSGPMTYLARPVVCDLAPSLSPINMVRGSLWVEMKVLLGAPCPHRVHGVVLKHYQWVWATLVILDQCLLPPDYFLLPCPCFTIGNKLPVQIEALAPAGRTSSEEVNNPENIRRNARQGEDEAADYFLLLCWATVMKVGLDLAETFRGWGSSRRGWIE